MRRHTLNVTWQFVLSAPGVGRKMSLSTPQSLHANHRLEEFDCAKPSLTDWLLRHARQAQGSGSAKTFVACDASRVAGYFSLTVGQIDTLEAPERILRGMGQYPIPLVILARLAIDRRSHWVAHLFISKLLRAGAQAGAALAAGRQPALLDASYFAMGIGEECAGHRAGTASCHCRRRN